MAIRRSSRSMRLGAAVTTIALATAAATSSHVAWATSFGVVATLPAVLVDLLHRRLPNRLVALAAAVLLGAAGVETAFGGHLSGAGAVLGAAAMALPLLGCHLLSPTSMGFGDVKLALVVGAALGFGDPILGLVALAIGSAGAAAVGLVMRRRTVAFGPAIVGGAAVVILATTITGRLT